MLPDSIFLVIPLFYLCIWFPVWYLFHFILQMGYNFLCFIEFERSANAPSIGEMWLVLSINRLNYRKTLIAAWWNYSWVVDIRRNTKLSIFPLFRRMSAMLDFRHIGISAMLGFRHIGFGHHLCFHHNQLRVYFNVNPVLEELCCLSNLLWLTVNYVF